MGHLRTLALAALLAAGPAAQAMETFASSEPITGSTIPLSQATLIPGAGTGQTYYVSTTGSDSNNGLSPQTAFATIQHAVNTVGPGGTIEIMGGTYAGGIVIDPSRAGTANAWITMEAYQGQKVTIDGSSLGASDPNNIFFYTPNPTVPTPVYWALKGLTIANAPQYTVQMEMADIKLIDNDIYGAHNDLVKLVQGAHDIVIWGNNIHNNNAAAGSNAQGVDMVGSENVLVAHNTLSNIASIGLYCKGNASNITFEDNALNNIYSRGIMLGESTGVQYLLPGKTYESYNSIIKNNVITNDQSACLAESSSYDAYIYNNSCYNAAIDRKGAILITNESVSGQGGTNVFVRDNIIEDFSTHPMVLIQPGAMTNDTTLHIDHNLYFNPGGATFQWDERGLYGASFAAWQRAGFDSDSLVANPLYADEGTLTLKQGSPAQHAGVPLQAVRHDFNGVRRPTEGPVAMGAYETPAGS